MTETAGQGAGLVLSDVRAGYDETIVLSAVSLALPPGATLAVLGRNGVGKTTLLTTVMGYTRLHGGSIHFQDRDIGALPIYQRAALGLALVPQEREIFRSLTVEENLTVGARAGRWTLERVYDFFPSLAARRNSRGDRLSGGEQQMLAIGRALMGNPNFLLMDEPLEGLAPVIVDQLLAGLERLKREEELALMLVEQHAHLALEFADTTIVLDRGAIVYHGASRDLADAPGLMSELLGVTARTERAAKPIQRDQ
jgi:branched-chain amino acid transport system ATP-binding protein